jgi:hypothetical protein
MFKIYVLNNGSNPFYEDFSGTLDAVIERANFLKASTSFDFIVEQQDSFGSNVVFTTFEEVAKV